MYFLAFGPGLTAALPLLFVAIVGGALIISHLSRNHRPLVYAQIASIIYVTTCIQWSIGEAFNSGFVMAWASMGPLIALMYFTPRQSVIWLALFVVNVAITAIFNDHFAASGLEVAPDTKLLFFAMNLAMPAIIIFAFASYFVRSALSEKNKADRLLVNILPEKIARTLKSQDGVVAEEFDNVSVMFADIVEFTRYADAVNPVELVSKLNDIFQLFDQLANRHGLEKIKTIGDAYMVVGGLPEPDPNHARAIANMALDMQQTIATIRKADGQPFALRIGIHTGSVVAGVIGSTKFAYDLWGDTVQRCKPT